MPKIDINGVVRDMTPEEVAAMPQPTCQEPTESECLQAQLAQTNADFMGFLDYFFSMFPEAE